MTPEIAAKLRAPFPPEKIGKLPRVTCADCRESRDRSCSKHGKSKCVDCGSWITSAHIHLDFVGHADATDRFLEVDSDWAWEPFALDGRGLPAFDDNGGMWIRLTVAGTTRIGYGDADGKKGPNAVKEAIGDALRNAGLRFGVALDLWRKESAVEVSERDRETGSPVAIELFADIVNAKTEPELKVMWEALKAAGEDGRINQRELAQLTAHVKRRKQEMQRDSTGDSHRGSADGTQGEVTQ